MSNEKGVELASSAVVDVPAAGFDGPVAAWHLGLYE
jgi:hypothetical protein